MQVLAVHAVVAALLTFSQVPAAAFDWDRPADLVIQELRSFGFWACEPSENYVTAKRDGLSCVLRTQNTGVQESLELKVDRSGLGGDWVEAVTFTFTPLSSTVNAAILEKYLQFSAFPFRAKAVNAYFGQPERLLEFCLRRGERKDGNCAFSEEGERKDTLHIFIGGVLTPEDMDLAISASSGKDRTCILNDECRARYEGPR